MLSLVFGMARGQNEGEPIEEDKPDYYYDVLGKIRSGLFFPSAYGNNFLAKNYDLRTGVHFEASVKIDKIRDLGIQFQGMQGIVTDTENLGQIDSSTITNGFLVLGHSLLGRKKDLELIANVGVGYMNLRNRVDFRRFNDSGAALMAGMELSYRFTTAFGCYVAFQNQWGFLGIDAADASRQFLRNTQVFTPLIGIKFYTL